MIEPQPKELPVAEVPQVTDPEDDPTKVTAPIEPPTAPRDGVCVQEAAEVDDVFGTAPVTPVVVLIPPLAIGTGLVTKPPALLAASPNAV